MVFFDEKDLNQTPIFSSQFFHHIDHRNLFSWFIFFFFLMIRPPPRSPLFPYTTLSRSEREQSLRTAVEPQARLGRLDPAARAVEQLRAEALLERSHLQADRRLRHPEPLRGLGEAAPLDDDAEGGELTRIHKRILCTDTVVCARGLRSRGGATARGHARQWVHTPCSRLAQTPDRRRAEGPRAPLRRRL